MRKSLHFSALAPFLFAVGMPAGAAENVPDILKRQTQEMVDAIATGKAAVWDKYLDEGVRYVDESGTVLTKKQMVEGTKPLPQGVTGTIKVVGFDAVVHGDVAVATYRTTDTWMKTRMGWRLIAAQVLALRTDPPPAPIAASLRGEYCGRYALTPSIAYEIRCNGETLEGQQTGRKPEELRAEAPDVLFVPGRPRYRYVFLRDAGGKITGFAQRREAWDLVWKRAPAPAKS